MKSNHIRATLEGLGTEQDVLYTNEEIIENLDELQRAIAGGLFAATHVECARARDIMAGIERLAIEHGLESTPEFQRLNTNMNYLGHTIACCSIRMNSVHEAPIHQPDMWVHNQ